VVDVAKEVIKPRTRHGTGLDAPCATDPPPRHVSYGTKAQERKHRPTSRLRPTGRCGGAAMDLGREAKARGGPPRAKAARSADLRDARRAWKRRAGSTEPMTVASGSGRGPRGAARSQARAGHAPQGAGPGRTTAQASGGPLRLRALSSSGPSGSDERNRQQPFTEGRRHRVGAQAPAGSTSWGHREARAACNARAPRGEAMSPPPDPIAAKPKTSQGEQSPREPAAPRGASRPRPTATP